MKPKKKSGKFGSASSIMKDRILILSIVIVAFFAILLGRLVVLQVFEHNEYVAKQDDYTSIHQYATAPRGQIYDRNGKILAKTEVSHNIVYQPPNNMSADDRMVYAKRAATVFNMALDDFSQRELQDAYLTWTSFLDSEDPRYGGYDLLSDEDLAAYRNGDWGLDGDSRLYREQIAAIDQDVLDSITRSDLITAAVYNRMISNISTGQASVVLEDVPDADVAYLVEHKTEFPGFDVDFGGWKRVYPYGETMADILGGVTNSTEGLPEESAEHYLSLGYQHNSQVGKSGLEYEYNELLAGTPEISKITYDSNGIAHKQVIQPAKKGYDLYLSIDIDLQTTMDETIYNVLSANGGSKNRENFSQLYMTLMNPTNGEVLAMGGYQKNLETGTMTYFGSGNYLTLSLPGSCVKGATVYMGQSEGVVNEGEVITDEIMNIGGEEFGSFSNHGQVDDVQALSVSSNVYMFNIAIRLGGAAYEEGQPLEMADTKSTLNLMRSYYSSFGLGNKTGIDIPNESASYMGLSLLPSSLLNYAIGQYDMYTTLQACTYASTIAEWGTMYQPHFYTYSKEVNGDQILDVNAPTIRSQLPEENKSHIDRVRQGFHACVEDGNCYDQMKNLPLDMAAKTGTAEAGEWSNANLIGFGPYDNPTVSFACMAPASSVNTEDVSVNICATETVPPVIQKYYELYYPDGTYIGN